MELICPECLGTLQLPQARVAVCPLHGGKYEVLFDRDMEALAVRTNERPILEGKTCAAHPSQNALAECGSCGKTLCNVCSFEVAGRQYCSDCAQSSVTAPAPPSPAPAPGEWSDFPSLNLTAPMRPSVPAGLMCARHVEVPAVAQCRGCSQGVCATCDFEMPGGLHLCPDCIDKAGDEEVSPKRRKQARLSVVCAFLATLFLVLAIAVQVLFASTWKPDDLNAVDVLLSFAMFVAGIAGIAYAFGAFDRRLTNTAMIWTGVIWNSVLVGIYVLLRIAAVLFS